ncbi:MAG: fimbrillin family protein [Bacteroidaceae bacterium]|nr:fimbrillin family protein [Bacteroidaceae bacterium]
MKGSFFLPMAAVALLASCSSDMELSQIGEKFDGKVTLSAPAYEYEDGTRTTLTSSESGISFAWDDDETIGIFPIAPTTNAQAHQKLDNGANNGTKSSFDGAGWALLRGNTYAAYYPFQTEEYENYTKIPIDMTGQTQDGNGSLAHIGAGYDYMYATATVPQNGNVNFDFMHVCSIVKLELTMPIAATWKNVTLLSDEDVFVTKATMNVTTGEVTPITKASSVVLNLNNVSTTSENEKLELYLAVLPITTGDLTITVLASDSYNYTSTLPNKTLKAGKAYLWNTDSWTVTQVTPTVFTCDGVESGHAYVDLGLSVKWATTNIGATSAVGPGDYYAYGETEPQHKYAYGSSSYSIYSLSSYKWCNGSYNTFFKYCIDSSYGIIDNKTTLEPEDDAATQNWGNAWRMPTLSELDELGKNCYWVWTSNYNNTKTAGYIIYKAKSSSDKGQVVFYNETPSSSYSLSDTHIFLPAAGNGFEGVLSGVGDVGQYRSSSLCESKNDCAHRILFGSNRLYYKDYHVRFGGMSVRAVCDK